MFRRSCARRGLPALILMVVGLSAALSATTHYVAVTGSDSNDGSASSPWRTIQHAANLVNPGDTVIVQDGTYAETLLMSRGGTSSAPVIFRAQNKWGARIAPTSTTGNYNYAILVGAPYITLQNFDISATTTSAVGIKTNYGPGQILGNKIHDIGMSTSTCTSGAAVLAAANTTIIGNSIYNIGPPRTASFRCNQQHGIYITAGSGGTVQNNIISQVWQGVGIHINGSNISNWTVSNNTIVNVGDNSHNTGGPFFFDCISGTCDYNRFTNNTFANTQGGYCWWEARESGATLGPHNLYQNNLTYNCGSAIWVTGSAQNSVTSDPQFVNYTGGNYHLSSSSPAIDRGTSTGAPAVDMDGVSRPQGSAVDIGAYEYNSTASSTIGVSISPTSATIQSGSSQTFTASVSGTTNTGVTWWVNGVQGGNSTSGTVSTSGLYVAPASVTTATSVTVTAKSVADSTKFASATVNITAPAPKVTVSVSPTSTTVQGGKSQAFTASVSGTTNTAVLWSVNGVQGGNASYGTISTTGVYTAPLCSATSGVTVAAQSVYDSSASGRSSVALTASSTPGVRYVANNGSDSNDGSACHPFATIQHAASVVNPGDTVIVQDGTYAETLLMSRGGTSSARVTFKAQHKWGAKIAPTSTTGNYNYAILVAAPYITLQDFDISATTTTGVGIKTNYGYGQILGNRIHDIGMSSSTCTSGAAVLAAANTTIVGNSIYNIGPPRTAGFRCNKQHGIYITAGSGGTVQNNLLSQVWQGIGIHIYGSNISNWTVSNNTIVNVGDNSHNTGGPFFFDCISGTCDYNRFTNNTFANTQGGYCWWEARESGATLGPHNLYLNNLTYNCGSTIWVTGKPQNGVTSNPLFVNYTGTPTGNYHLSSSSPAINRGTSTGAPTVDMDGVPRPQGSAIDIGAYEYKAP